MARIELASVTTGATSSYNVYVSDVYGNNLTLLGSVNQDIPPQQFFYLPEIFENAPAIIIKLVQSNGCEIFQVVECRYGCGFQIGIEFEECNGPIVITYS